ncbi:MAG: vitamin K epoxide reductase/DsbA family protein [Bdellovibrionales bacterium]
MKTRIQLALMGCLASIAAHIYLTLHFYPIKFGFSAGPSVCNLSAKFDCDAVAASNYSSVFGMPIALWGAATNAVLFALILFSWLEWTEFPERLKRWTALLAGLSFATSIVMALISLTQMQSYCLFCITVYGLSTIVFFSYIGMVHEPFIAGLKSDIPHLWSESKGILIAFAVIPVLAYVGHQSFMQNLGDAQIDKLVQESVEEWQHAPKQEFVAKPSLVVGPAADHATMTLVEFADFRCSHCRHASYTLDAFVKSHPDVRFEFYSFPLDGACNEKIEGSSGVSCRLATAVLCAEKEGKGWELHGALYNMQDETIRMPSTNELDPFLAQTVAPLGLSWERMQTCMNDPASLDAIKAQAKQGGLVNVQGTPTMFVNGRQLNRGQILPVLQAVRQKSIDTKGQ